MIRLIHLADIHPLSKGTIAGKAAIDPQTGRSLTLEDARKSLQFVLEQATTPPACDLAVIAGDLFDSHTPTMDEVAVVTEFLVQLQVAMPVVCIAGNHDLNISGQSASALTPLIHRNIQIVEAPSSQFFLYEKYQVRIDFLPYPSKGRLLANCPELAQASSEEITEHINRRLRAIMEGLRVEHQPGEIHLLVAHGSVSGVTVGEQPRSLSHDILIPRDCFEPYDYVALGHVHLSQQVADKAWYSGSLLRQTFGEEGEPKGLNIVEIDGPGAPPRVTFIENPHARTYRTVTLTELAEIGGAEAVRDHPETVWRIKDSLSQEDYEASKELIREFQQSAPFTQITLDIVRPDRMRDAGMTELLTPDDALARALEGKVPEDERGAVLAKHQALLREVGA